MSVDLSHSVLNPLPDLSGVDHIAGIIGDRPSQYAKSPSLWNAAFRALEVNAVFLPFDVDPPGLAPLVHALRDHPRIVGFSVTVPYKTAVIPLLDDLDPLARMIGAVNTVSRRSDGTLVGFNTDGQGAIDALTSTVDPAEKPFRSALAGARVALVGAGGAAKATAFYLARAIGAQGRITILNRSAAKGAELAERVASEFGNANAAPTAELSRIVRDVDLVVNASTCGQSGIRKLADGGFTCLEPYSALGLADAPVLRCDGAAPQDLTFFADWFGGARDSILENRARATDVISAGQHRPDLFDLVYSPFETTTMRLARWGGWRTLNGKAMNIAQAADAFARRVMPATLSGNGRGDQEALYRRVFQIMASVW